MRPRAGAPSGDATVKLAAGASMLALHLFGVRSPNKFGAPLPPSDAPLPGCDRGADDDADVSGFRIAYRSISFRLSLTLAHSEAYGRAARSRGQPTVA